MKKKILLNHIVRVFKNIYLLNILFLSTLLFSCKKEKAPTLLPSPPPIVIETDPCSFGKFNGIVVDYQSTRAEVNLLETSTVHSWFHWDLIEREIFEPFFTVEEVTEEMIKKYSSGEQVGIDWTSTDEHLEKYDQLRIVMGVGSGLKSEMPLLDGTKITPDRIGRAHYLGQLYLHTRSVVRRYKSKVIGWQIENEPNIAPELNILGHRDGDSWKDADFMTEVLAVLEKAVRAEIIDTDAWVTINFNLDVEDYESDIKKWLPFVDVVGLDTYQDYFTFDPIIAVDTIINRVERIRKFSEEKPVMLLEVGYASAPTSLGFSEANQNVFIDSLYSRLDKSKTCGAFYFKHTTPEVDGTIFFSHRNYRGLMRLDGNTKESWNTIKNYLD